MSRPSFFGAFVSVCCSVVCWCLLCLFAIIFGDLMQGLLFYCFTVEA